MNLLNIDTDFYGIIGNPVKHSLSPFLHNNLFKKYELNKIYNAYQVINLKKSMADFREMKIKGLSVTIPHKIEIIDYLDEIDETSKNIGSVNTVVAFGSKLSGFNTDVTGAVKAILNITPIENKNVLMLGAGGVARAIGYGIVKNKGNLIISNRTTEKGEKLADDLNCKFKPADNIKSDEVDILINATSIGMTPNIDAIPIQSNFLKDMIVFDTVYNPLRTKLITEAEKNGCKTISGLKMFIYQAAEQFKLWTGINPDIKYMEEILNNEMHKSDTDYTD